MSQLKLLEKKIKALSQRERAAVLLLGIAAIVLPVDHLVISPMLVSIKAISKTEPALISNRSVDLVQIEAIKEGIEIARLRSVLAAKQNEYEKTIRPLLDEARSHLLEPAQVARFLREMIPVSGTLRLAAIKSQPATKEDRAAGLYRHPFDVEFTGSYNDIVEHMARLQRSMWRMSIDQMVLENSDAELPKLAVPKVRLKIRIVAFSDSNTWLATPEPFSGSVQKDRQ